MISRTIELLKERCDATFDTGDSETDFRSRMIASLSGVFMVCALTLILDDLLGGFYQKAALLLLIVLGLSACLWLLLFKNKIDLSSSVLVGTVVGVLAIGLGVTGGTSIGAFVCLPVVVFLACVVCSRRAAILYTTIIILVAIVGAWLPTSGWEFPVGIKEQTSWLLGRTSVAMSAITMIAVFLYRDSAESIRTRATVAQSELAISNAELSSVVQSHLASAQLMFKVQEIGNLMGWWYEPATGNVHYTASKRGKFRTFPLTDLRKVRKSLPLLNADLRERIADRVAAATAWDDEVKILDTDGKAFWYRDSGEAELRDGKVVRLVGVLQDITDTKTLTNQLEVHATYDELTGLYNRRTFWKAVEAEYAVFDTQEKTSFLLYIDLDQFKLVNDTSGHAAGDRLLVLVASLLQDNVHSTDVVGRVGGDEFGLIIRDCTPDIAGQVADRLRIAIEKIQFHWSGETFRVGASIGVIGIDKVHGSADELQQLVDAACYEAKLAGRNRVNFYEEGEDIIAAQRGEARWVQRLHDAMTHDRFELHGQLIKPVEPTGAPDRYEVLLRLRDVEGDRLIPPGAFLPAAERFGLGPQIDQWVLGHLLKNLHIDPDARALNRTYWVNLSGNSIGDKKFARYLVETMANSTLPRGMINFEITETAVIRNIEEATKLIAELRDMGCQFALDDFGSGLSSFGYLKKLPVDYLKIDGMFVREILEDETDRVFVRAIINIAQTMGIKTVAEFVENDEIYNVVADFGVDYVQGYGVHRPERLDFFKEQPEVALAKRVG